MPALAAAVEGRPTDAGTVVPDIALSNVTKLNVTRLPFEIAPLAADIAGGAMLTLPGQADLEHAKLGPLVTKYMTASPEVPAVERMALFRLLEFLTHGSGAVYFLHESLHGAGAPEAMRDPAPARGAARAVRSCGARAAGKLAVASHILAM
jgi:4-hydroxybutyryl-CoA dehydratase/vinylacetyl-CoA-Delta-isomerase